MNLEEQAGERAVTVEPVTVAGRFGSLELDATEVPSQAALVNG